MDKTDNFNFTALTSIQEEITIEDMPTNPNRNESYNNLNIEQTPPLFNYHSPNKLIGNISNTPLMDSANQVVRNNNKKSSLKIIPKHYKRYLIPLIALTILAIGLASTIAGLLGTQNNKMNSIDDTLKVTQQLLENSQTSQEDESTTTPLQEPPTNQPQQPTSKPTKSFIQPTLSITSIA